MEEPHCKGLYHLELRCGVEEMSCKASLIPADYLQPVLLISKSPFKYNAGLSPELYAKMLTVHPQP